MEQIRESREYCNFVPPPGGVSSMLAAGAMIYPCFSEEYSRGRPYLLAD